MPTRATAADHASDTAASTAAPPRLVVWLELPQSKQRDAADRAATRDSWYDPAALYEEPERWDGMA
jgi:hypothetical protein